MGNVKKEEKVLERVYDPDHLNKAWRQVKRNKGAAGIDNITIKEFIKRIKEYAPIIVNKLKEGKWRFRPARRALIKKPGSNKMRKLGIPIVMDRIVGQSVNLVLEEIFDKHFSPSNFGFRKGKSQHMAIQHLKEIEKEGYKWCVSIDLKSFFDEIPHGLIFKLLRRKINDERMITLIARACKAGVMVNGKIEKTPKGTAQGSPMSPILSNIVLNELDQLLDKRGHKFCRWADDFVILLKSERAAIRTMEKTVEFLEKELGLPVNKEKSKVDLLGNITFLGFNIYRGKIKISPKSIKKFNKKIKEMTPRNNPFSMQKIIGNLNKFLRGWANYFKIQELKKGLKSLDGHVRSRIRSMQLSKWKKPKRFQKEMIKSGRWTIKEAYSTHVIMKRWRSVKRREVLWTLNIKWMETRGLVTMAKL